MKNKRFKVDDVVNFHWTLQVERGWRIGVVLGYGQRREYVDSVTGKRVWSRPVKIKLSPSGKTIRAHEEWVYPAITIKPIPTKE